MRPKTTVQRFEIHGYQIIITEHSSDAQVFAVLDSSRHLNRVWKLIPVKLEGASPRQSPETLGSGSPPSYDGARPGQSSARTQVVESEHDDFGTIVTEVTTITTRRRYRADDV